MLRFTLLAIFFVLLGACAPSGTPTASPPSSPSSDAYAPQPGDSTLTRSKFFLDKEGTSILTLESDPLQFTVSLKGSLPTPCHQPRIVVAPPDAENKIVLEAYSVVNPDRVCVQTIQMFAGNIPLGSFPQGHYSVWVNGEKIGEIDA